MFSLHSLAIYIYRERERERERGREGGRERERLYIYIWKLELCVESYIYIYIYIYMVRYVYTGSELIIWFACKCYRICRFDSGQSTEHSSEDEGRMIYEEERTWYGREIMLYIRFLADFHIAGSDGHNQPECMFNYKRRKFATDPNCDSLHRKTSFSSIKRLRERIYFLILCFQTWVPAVSANYIQSCSTNRNKIRRCCCKKTSKRAILVCYDLKWTISSVAILHLKMEIVQLLFVVSLTVNISVAVYFFPPMLLVCFLSKQKRRRVAMEFLRFNTKRPNVVRKL